jgi:hypothetical protein
MLDVRHRSCRCESRLREQCERCQRKRSGERAQLRGGGARSSGGPRRFLGAAHTLYALWLVFSHLPRSCACPAPRAPRLAPAAPPLAWLLRASPRRAPSRPASSAPRARLRRAAPLRPHLPRVPSPRCVAERCAASLMG